jgi:hypothetical protein
MRLRFDPWLVLSIILLAGLGFNGTWSGFHDLASAENQLQFATSITSIGYGLLALIAVPGLLINWRGLRPVLHLWLIAITVTGGLAPVAWGGASIGTGIAALLLTLVVGLVIIWVIRRAQVAP